MSSSTLQSPAREETALAGGMALVMAIAAAKLALHLVALLASEADAAGHERVAALIRAQLDPSPR